MEKFREGLGKIQINFENCKNGGGHLRRHKNIVVQTL